MSKLTMKEESLTPSTPTTGKWRFYPKSDGWYVLDDTGTEVGPLGLGGGGGTYPCFVRCSVVTGDPNPTADYLAQTSIYAFPYKGDTYAQWDGAAFASQAFTVQTLSLNASHTANSVYDIYLWLDGATQRVVTGPAWSSATSRGTGAGTAEIETVNGVAVNKVSMTVRNGATTYTMPARYGTVIGTFQASANGQVEWSAKYRGIYNFYNKMIAEMHICPGYNSDSAATSYNISSTTYVEANGGTGSRIKYVLGEASNVNFMAIARTQPAATGATILSIGLDTITNPTGFAASQVTNLDTIPYQDNNKGVPMAIGARYASLLFAYWTASPSVIYADVGTLRGGASTDPEATYMNGRILM